MTNAWPIVMIAVGVAFIVIKGIIGFWNDRGRGKWMYDKFGPTGAKIINSVFGLLIVAFGVVWLLMPDLFGKG